MVIKDFFFLKYSSRHFPPTLNAVSDLVLIWGALVVGIKLGREVIRSKICGWNANSVTFIRPNIITGYLCERMLGWPSYVAVYRLTDMEVSFDEARALYGNYQSMQQKKIDLSEW